MSDALNRLAAHYGIAADYHDVWGTLHRVPDTTLRALLAAMGVSIVTAQDAKLALAAAEKRRHRPLAPMVVVRQGEAHWHLEMVVSAASARAAFEIRIVTETGEPYPDAMLPVLPPEQALPSPGDAALATRVVELPPTLPMGYHTLEVHSAGQLVARTCLAVVPRMCYRGPALVPPHRAWGPAVQLYGVASLRNWGIGDFTDLAILAGQWAARGADFVGVNPLHALFPHNPRHASPYSPSSRLFGQWLYLDVEAIADFAECDDVQALVASDAFQATLTRLREAELVDYAGVAAVKRQVLELLHAHFRRRHAARSTARNTQFRAFVDQGGMALARHARFEALQEHLAAAVPSPWGWPAWPEPYRDPATAAVEQFAQAHADRINFYLYLQWQIALQQRSASAAARAAGMSVGLYFDLAVSGDRAGADTWASQDLYAVAASVGAPPDAFSMQGQNWGLPPVVPERLRDAAYAPFLATLRANMRDAGALRMDHVMGLLRLFWIPEGASPAAGAYVLYPLDDLLGLLALESHRHRCVVIGEDLGTVPDEVRLAMADRGVLSYRVLLFERDDTGEFKAPSAYPEAALVTASTHDLPTLAGWWHGDDVALRADRRPEATDEDRAAELAERAADRERLLRALERERLLPQDETSNGDASRSMTPALAQAIQTFLARAPSALAVVQVEDIVCMRTQANLPGTTDDHPNWQRKLPLPLERWPHDQRFLDLTDMFRRSRS